MPVGQQSNLMVSRHIHLWKHWDRHSSEPRVSSSLLKNTVNGCFSISKTIITYFLQCCKKNLALERGATPQILILAAPTTKVFLVGDTPKYSGVLVAEVGAAPTTSWLWAKWLIYFVLSALNWSVGQGTLLQLPRRGILYFKLPTHGDPAGL